MFFDVKKFTTFWKNGCWCVRDLKNMMDVTKSHIQSQ